MEVFENILIGDFFTCRTLIDYKGFVEQFVSRDLLSSFFFDSNNNYANGHCPTGEDGKMDFSSCWSSVLQKTQATIMYLLTNQPKYFCQNQEFYGLDFLKFVQGFTCEYLQAKKLLLDKYFQVDKVFKQMHKLMTAIFKFLDPAKSQQVAIQNILHNAREQLRHLSRQFLLRSIVVGWQPCHVMYENNTRSTRQNAGGLPTDTYTGKMPHQPLFILLGYPSDSPASDGHIEEVTAGQLYYVLLSTAQKEELSDAMARRDAPVGALFNCQMKQNLPVQCFIDQSKSKLYQVSKADIVVEHCSYKVMPTAQPHPPDVVCVLPFSHMDVAKVQRPRRGPPKRTGDGREEEFCGAAYISLMFDGQRVAENTDTVVFTRRFYLACNNDQAWKDCFFYATRRTFYEAGAQEEYDWFWGSVFLQLFFQWYVQPPVGAATGLMAPPVMPMPPQVVDELRTLSGSRPTFNWRKMLSHVICTSLMENNVETDILFKDYFKEAGALIRKSKDKDVLTYWNEGWIRGFVTRESATRLLKECGLQHKCGAVGLLRFATKELGRLNWHVFFADTEQDPRPPSLIGASYLVTHDFRSSLDKIHKMASHTEFPGTIIGATGVKESKQLFKGFQQGDRVYSSSNRSIDYGSIRLNGDYKKTDKNGGSKKRKRQTTTALSATPSSERSRTTSSASSVSHSSPPPALQLSPQQPQLPPRPPQPFYANDIVTPSGRKLLSISPTPSSVSSSPIQQEHVESANPLPGPWDVSNDEYFLQPNQPNHFNANGIQRQFEYMNEQQQNAAVETLTTPTLDRNFSKLLNLTNEDVSNRAMLDNYLG